MQWLKKKWKDIKDFFNVLKELRTATTSLNKYLDDLSEIVSSDRIEILKLTGYDRQYLLGEIEKLQKELTERDESDRNHILNEIKTTRESLREFDESDRKELHEFIQKVYEDLNSTKKRNGLKQ